MEVTWSFQLLLYAKTQVFSAFPSDPVVYMYSVRLVGLLPVLYSHTMVLSRFGLFSRTSLPQRSYVYVTLPYWVILPKESYSMSSSLSKVRVLPLNLYVETLSTNVVVPIVVVTLFVFFADVAYSCNLLHNR